MSGVIGRFPAREVFVVAALSVLGFGLAYGQSGVGVERRSYETRRITGAAPVIDGRIDEAVWDTVPWSGDFVQRDPSDGDEPTYPSEFKVLFDDDALYFAFRLHDDPTQLSSHLERRDRFPGDWIEVNIDSYRDRRTAFSFTFSLSGTRGDEYISRDGDSWDPRWDPVWGGASQKDEQGWTAETRIPLSQLRFNEAEDQVWGLQVQRRLFRLEERSTWQHIPKDSTGWVSQFGELRGLERLRPKRRIEVLPYVVARAERSEPEAGNPFGSGSEEGLDAGVDGRLGLGSNFTLDFTLNPDFGQVEADPSEVNLSAFETFFEERRPFFIEGQEVYDLRVAPARSGGSFTRDNLFYSRRIGRPPTFEPEIDEEAFADQPTNTSILGAFKLTGKTAGGLSVGLLDGVTDRERAVIDLAGERSSQTVEPMTNFFVGRLRQDFRDGDTQLGGMVTTVNRKLDEDVDFLTGEAYAGGIDFSTYFANRDYRFEATLIGSEIHGSPEAIEEAQTSPARYYQRPDNDAASFDPNRTSLSGHGGSLRFERTDNHDLRFQTGVGWRSPGFEINDLGFMRDANRINQFTWVGYVKRNPFSIFDRLEVNGRQWLDFDFGGNFLGAWLRADANAQFRNKTRASIEIGWAGETISNTELRGGPSSKWPGEWSFEADYGTDRRRDFSASIGVELKRGDEGSLREEEVGLDLHYRPTQALRLSLNPSFQRRRPELQYIDTETFGDESRYLFGRLNQETLSLSIRLDYAITPNLTVQYYGAPFISSGRYSALKRTTDPRAAAFRDRFAVFDQEQVRSVDEGASFAVDEDLDGIDDYQLENPDFDVRELNSNLVVRWEFSPGSTLYVVWSQARGDSELLPGGLGVSRDYDQLFSAPAENVFLIKVSKWFSP